MSPETMFHNAASNIICTVLFGARYEYDDEALKVFIKLYTENAKIANGPWAMVRLSETMLCFLVSILTPQLVSTVLCLCDLDLKLIV